MKKRARAPKSHQEFLVKTTMARSKESEENRSSRGGSSTPTRTSPRHGPVVQATLPDGYVDPRIAARKRAAHKVTEKANNDKRKKDPTADYTDHDETDSEVEERHQTKKRPAPGRRTTPSI